MSQNTTPQVLSCTKVVVVVVVKDQERLRTFVRASHETASVVPVVGSLFIRFVFVFWLFVCVSNVPRVLLLLVVVVVYHLRLDTVIGGWVL